MIYFFETCKNIVGCRRVSRYLYIRLAFFEFVNALWLDSSLATCHTCACRVQPDTPQSIIFWRASDESVPKQSRSIGYTQTLHAGPSLLPRFPPRGRVMLHPVVIVPSHRARTNGIDFGILFSQYGGEGVSALL